MKIEVDIVTPPLSNMGGLAGPVAFAADVKGEQQPAPGSDGPGELAERGRALVGFEMDDRIGAHRARPSAVRDRESKQRSHLESDVWVALSRQLHHAG